MVSRYSFAACLALAAIMLSACSRENTASPQTANPAAPAPQADNDSGDGDEALGEAASPSPRISLEPRREAPRNGFAPLETPEQDPLASQPPEEEPPSPSLFRSLGRALTRGVKDAVTGSGGEAPAEAPPDDAAPGEGDQP